MKHKTVENILFILLFACFSVFCQSQEKGEIGFVRFMPDSSDIFEDEKNANSQLDEWANTLKNSELSKGQIRVEGFTADVENGIDPVKLSKDRALFIINELEKRGVSPSFFSEPVGHGATTKYSDKLIPESMKENRRAILINNVNNSPVINNEKVKKAIKLPDISGLLNKIKLFFSFILNKIKLFFLFVLDKINIFLLFIAGKLKSLLPLILAILEKLKSIINAIWETLKYIILVIWEIIKLIIAFLIYLYYLLLGWLNSTGLGGGKGISLLLLILGLILIILGYKTGIFQLCIAGLILMIMGGLLIIIFFILKILLLILMIILAVAAILYSVKFLGQLNLSFPTIRSLRGMGMPYKKILEISQQTGGGKKVKLLGKNDKAFGLICENNINYLDNPAEDEKYGNLVDPKRRAKLLKNLKKLKEGKLQLIIKNGFFKNPDVIAYRKASVRDIGLKYIPDFRYPTGPKDSDPHGRGRPGIMDISNILYAKQNGLVKKDELKTLKQLAPQVYNKKGSPRCSDDTLNKFKSLSTEIRSRIKNDSHSFLINNMQTHESEDLHTVYLVPGEFHSTQKNYSDWRKLEHTGGQSKIKASGYYD